MQILDRSQDAELKERQLAQSVRVRVRPNGPVVDLPPGNITVGSSPRCNIRIQQPGVQPLHCLILHESGCLSIRRWSGETVLNGERLEESSLGPGDCLQIGPVELEIVEPQGTALPAADATMPIVAPAPVWDGKSNTDRLQVGRDVARSRTRQLLTALRQGRDANRELRQRVVNLERQLEWAAADQQNLTDQLQSSISELDAVRRQVADQQGFTAGNQELAAQNEQLGREVCALTQRVDRLTGEQAQSSAAQRALAEERESLAAENRRLADENSRLQEQIGHQSNRNSELCAQRDEARSQNELLRADSHLLVEKEETLAEEVRRLEHELAQFQLQSAELEGRVSEVSRERNEARDQLEPLRAEVQSLTDSCAASTENVRRLEHEHAQLQQHAAEQSNQLSDLRGELDELRAKNEQLCSELTELSQERASLADDLAANNRDRDELRQQLHAQVEEQAVRTSEHAELVAECERLREEAGRLTQLEQEVRDAVAERETTSSELYRALLQLAEVQERDGHNAALAAAHEALKAELEKSVQDVAELQAQVDRLTKEQAAADEAPQALDRQTAASDEAQRRQVDEITALAADVAQLREQLEAIVHEKDELIGQLESASAWRERFEESEHNHSALTETVARLQSELADKQQAEAAAAGAISERDQQISEYADLLAESRESVRLLEQKLAAAGEDDGSFEQARDALLRELEESTYQQTEMARRIAGLESQLLEAESAACQANQLSGSQVESQYHTPWGDDSIENTESAGVAPRASLADSGHVLAASSVESASSCDWSDTRSKAPELDSAQLKREAVATTELQSDQAVAWIESPNATSKPHQANALRMSNIERYSHTFADDAAAIDPQPVPVVAPLRAEENSTRKPRNLGVAQLGGGSSSLAGGDVEESIEEYMKKLLQRVRGESPTPTANAVPMDRGDGIPPLTRPVGVGPAPLTVPPSVASGDLLSSINSDLGKRKVSMPAPQTDLEALRALANESARRAISRHTRRKHRKNAITKVIVSSLAGFTSLWLMFHSENMISLQFVTACVSILVAAYWAGETLRSLLEALRVAARDETDAEIEELTLEIRSTLATEVES
ncbi:MAG: FHA domain-containing protein [Planctomycetes bacterium]|nr:FHA domain-containing protein [Planctomycetota bacterium]